MKFIVVKDDFAFVYLTASFYNMDKVVDTLRVYKDFLKGSVAKVGKYLVVKLERVDNENSLDMLTREFSNYVLAQEYEVKTDGL